jgi:hypothetical protein
MPQNRPVLYVASVLNEMPLWPELQAPPRSRRPARSARASRRRRTVGIVAVTVSLVIAAGSAYGLGLFDPGARTADPQPVVADAHAAVAENAALRGHLATEIKDARAVLKSPDGRAAAKSDRQALDAAIDDARSLVKSLESVASSPPGTAAEVSAVLERTSELHQDAPAVTAALRDATTAVVISGRLARLERAGSGLEEARTTLQAVMADGERAYAESEAAAEVPDRDSLRVALDESGDLVARADGLLETAAGVKPRSDALADLLGQARELTTAMSEAAARIEDAIAAVVMAAQEDGADAEADGSDPAAGDTGGEAAADVATEENAGTTAPAGTCPEPDQVWSAENGHLSSSELAQIPFASGHYVRADVVGGLTELNEAYAAEFGVNLTINSSYRTYADQEALYDPTSKTAAPPGCSNHGTGLAIDIGGGVQTFGSAQYEWLKANAEAYGWVHPPFAEPSGRNPEPWHWQSVHAPNSY